MVHVVFVHGTGVREPGFGVTLEAVRAGLEPRLPGVTVHPCYWGGSCGSDIGAGRSIPLYAQSQALGGPATSDAAQAEWSLLLDDPLIELRLLAARAGGKPSGVPGRSPADILRAQIEALQQRYRTVFQDELHAAGLDAYQVALARVLALPELASAIRAGVDIEPSGTDKLDAMRYVVARAIVAGAMAELAAELGMVFIATQRDRLVELSSEQLGGPPPPPIAAQTMGLGARLLGAAMTPLKDMLRSAVLDPSLRMATWGSRRYRHSLANVASPAAGDILLYQARGAKVRDFIENTARGVKHDVVLLAHSLGGIACLDMLIGRRLPFVKGLITAGSQAPFLYEIGALSQLEKDKPVPAHLPPWLNFYDRNDILSFLAAPVMLGSDQPIRDVEVSSGQPFLAAHSAYWENPAVWEASAKFITSL